MYALDEMIKDGQPHRERCTYCGMTANLDPAGHAERYAHTPTVRRDGKTYRFDFTTYTFSILVDD